MDVGGTRWGEIVLTVRPVFEVLRDSGLFERWRSLRALQRLKVGGRDIFLSPVDPASVCEIIIRPECAIVEQLEELMSADPRYRHVLLSTVR